jgi:hypothetical protein
MKRSAVFRDDENRDVARHSLKDNGFSSPRLARTMGTPRREQMQVPASPLRNEVSRKRILFGEVASERAAKVVVLSEPEAHVQVPSSQPSSQKPQEQEKDADETEEEDNGEMDSSRETIDVARADADRSFDSTGGMDDSQFTNITEPDAQGPGAGSFAVPAQAPPQYYARPLPSPRRIRQVSYFYHSYSNWEWD